MWRDPHANPLSLLFPPLPFFSTTILHLLLNSLCSSRLTAIVTGSSDGIGAQFALQLAAKGMNVVLAARRKEKLEQVASECREKGVKAKVVICDFSDLERYVSSGGEDMKAETDVQSFLPSFVSIMQRRMDRTRRTHRRNPSRRRPRHDPRQQRRVGISPSSQTLHHQELTLFVLLVHSVSYDFPMRFDELPVEKAKTIIEVNVKGDSFFASNRIERIRMVVLTPLPLPSPFALLPSCSLARFASPRFQPS